MRQRACGALIQDGMILMVHHVHDGKEYWTLPGGGVDEGETATAAAEREMLEETGVKARVVRLLYDMPWTKENNLERCFLMEPVDPNQKAATGGDPEEAHLPADRRILQEARWRPLAEVKNDVQVAKVIEALNAVSGARVPALIEEMNRYYEARAPEYDEWWERRGRYNLGPEQNKVVKAEAAEVEQILNGLPLEGDMLEFAGGTGIWTEYLARRARRLLVLDASPTMLRKNQERLAVKGLLPRVRYEQADLFAWRPNHAYDAAYASFWVSHIPADRLDAFFGVAAAALRPGGTFVILESQPARPRAPGQGTKRVDNDVEIRTLNDGVTYRIVKREMHAEELAASLERAGFAATFRKTATHFLLMIGTKRS